MKIHICIQVLNIYINQLGDLDLAERHCSRVYTNATSHALETKSGDIKEIAKDGVRSSDYADSSNHTRGKKGNSGMGGEDEGAGVSSEGDISIYLCLLKILLTSVASREPVQISVLGEMKTSSFPPSSSSPSSPTTSSSNVQQQVDDRDDKEIEKIEINAINKLKSNQNIKNFKVDDVIEVAERCHDKIDTIAFLSFLPKNIPLFQIEKYLRLVLEFGNHKKRNLMVRISSRTCELTSFSFILFNQ